MALKKRIDLKKLAVKWQWKNGTKTLQWNKWQWKNGSEKNDSEKNGSDKIQWKRVVKKMAVKKGNQKNGSEQMAVKMAVKNGSGKNSSEKMAVKKMAVWWHERSLSLDPLGLNLFSGNSLPPPKIQFTLLSNITLFHFTFFKMRNFLLLQRINF